MDASSILSSPDLLAVVAAATGLFLLSTQYCGILSENNANN